jgi:hypothetical protein
MTIDATIAGMIGAMIEATTAMTTVVVMVQTAEQIIAEPSRRIASIPR